MQTLPKQYINVNINSAFSTYRYIFYVLCCKLTDEYPACCYGLEENGNSALVTLVSTFDMGSGLFGH